MEPMISVIVPVYKVEPYLCQCVDSIRNQTYANLEIILVDDGSPDGCPQICDEYAALDTRIKVIHKKNGGLSDARNVGMAVSKGEYLCFVDSDDALPQGAVEDLLKLAVAEEADLVIGGHCRFEEEIPADATIETEKRLMSRTEAMADFFANGCAAWARLYRREVHGELLFPVGEINEDEAIVLKLLDRCNTIAKIDTVVYYYRCRPESITTSAFSAKKMDWYYHCRNNLEWVKTRYPNLASLATGRLAGCVVFLLDEIAKAKQPFPEFKTILVDDLKQNYPEYRKAYRAGKNAKIRMWILKSLPFGCYRFLMACRRRLHR